MNNLLASIDSERARANVGRVFAFLFYLLSVFIWISLFRSDFCAADAREVLCTKFVNSPELPTVLETVVFVVGFFYLPISIYVAGIILTAWLFGEFVIAYPNDPVEFTVHKSDRKIAVVLGTIVNLIVSAVSWLYYILRCSVTLVMFMAWPVTLVFGLVFSAIWYGILSPLEELTDTLDIPGL